MDFLVPSTVFNLTLLRGALERLEDTIIYGFIERSQYAELPLIYLPGAYMTDGFNGSLLELHLRKVEQLQLQLRRYTAPDEVPFFPNAVEPEILPQIDYPSVLSLEKNLTSVNDVILNYYVTEIVPRISASGDPTTTMGAALLADITLLQAISRRVHLGRYVAEAKYIADKQLYVSLIRSKNVTAIRDSVTNHAQENLVVARVVQKTRRYGTAPHLKNTKINPHTVAAAYRKIISLTKDVEVRYLLNRV